MATRHSEYERDEDEWYVEPRWAVAALFDRLPFHTGLHDPCAGQGTIVDAAADRGIAATGADKVDRAGGRFAVRDYLSDSRVYPNVVCNPPFSIAVSIIHHALEHVVDNGRVAVFAPIAFLASQHRYPLFRRPECELVLIFSRRPNCPPGAKLQEFGESFRRNASDDFTWIVFRRGRCAEMPRIDWLLNALDYNPLED